MSTAPRLSIVNPNVRPVETDTCGAWQHALIVDEARDAETLRGLIPGASVWTFDDLEAANHDEVTSLAEGRYVLVVLPGDPCPDLLTRARSGVARLDRDADEVTTVAWTSWAAGTPFAPPSGVSTPGAMLVWLRALPELETPLEPPPRSNGKPVSDGDQADRWPEGTLVKATDRDNYGFVVHNHGPKVAVRFESTSGHKTIVSLPKTLLIPQGNFASTKESSDEDEEDVVDHWPKSQLGAFYGLPGRMVATLDPHTESDRVATLIQILVAFTNMIGRGPHFAVGADRHYLNLFAALCGPTAAGRKGSSLGVARFGLDPFDPNWATTCVKSGLISGEGLIFHVRDAVYREEEVEGKGGQVTMKRVMVDSGVSDKRLLVVETEMSRMLKAMNRESNTLSDVIRQAWDSGNLATMGKHAANNATNAHISIIVHVTKADVEKFLAKEDAQNGFANRFLWCAVRRSKELPEGGDLFSDEFALRWEPIRHELEQVVAFARQCGRMRRDAEARNMWKETYGKLTAGKPGILGAILGRAEPQVMRLACVFALFDQTDTVRCEHLNAALSLWQYCEDSTKYIFASTLANADAEKLLRAIRESPGGLSRTEISGVFNGKRNRGTINGLLTELFTEGHVHRIIEKTGNHRPTERWKAGREGAEHAAK